MNNLKILAINHFHLCTEFRKLGHEVFLVAFKKPPAQAPWDAVIESSFTNIESIFEILPSNFKPTHIFYQDNSEPPHLYGFENLNIPTIFYAVDTHIHRHWQRFYALGFDGVAVAQKDHIRDFIELGANAHWFPLWAQNSMEPKKFKSIDFCFRGNLDPNINPKRIEFFRELSKTVKVDFKTGPYEEDYASSKIIINQALSNDVNFRVFEAMMSGALLITPHTGNGLEELFTPEKHLVTYKDGDVDDAAQKAHYFIEHEDERIKIANAGREEILKKHTAIIRAQEICDFMISLKIKPAKNKFLGLASAFLTYYLAYKKYAHPISRIYLNEALKLTAAYADSKSEANELFILNTMLCQYYLESFENYDMARQFIEQIYTYYPDNILLNYCKIRALRKSNLDSDAKEFAIQKFSDTEMAFSKSEKLFDSFKLQ